MSIQKLHLSLWETKTKPQGTLPVPWILYDQLLKKQFKPSSSYPQPSLPSALWRQEQGALGVESEKDGERWQLWRPGDSGTKETVTSEGAKVMDKGGACYNQRNTKLWMLNLKPAIFYSSSSRILSMGKVKIIKRLRCHQMEGEEIRTSKLLTKQASKSFGMLWCRIHLFILIMYLIINLYMKFISVIYNWAHIIRKFLNFFIFATF